MEREISFLFSLFLCTEFYLRCGIIAFLLGRLVPKKWFVSSLPPYRCLSFEKEGRFYDRFRIREWQDKVPDMSKISRRLMPPKALTRDLKERLPRMIQETCVAELTHGLLCLTGFYCFHYFPGVGGVVVWLIYVLVFNLPYMLIQRYNRPRLLRLYEYVISREQRKTARERGQIHG